MLLSVHMLHSLHTRCVCGGDDDTHMVVVTSSVIVAYCIVVMYQKMMKLSPEAVGHWEDNGQAKITVKVESEEELYVLYS